MRRISWQTMVKRAEILGRDWDMIRLGWWQIHCYNHYLPITTPIPDEDRLDGNWERDGLHIVLDGTDIDTIDWPTVPMYAQAADLAPWPGGNQLCSTAQALANRTP